MVDGGWQKYQGNYEFKPEKFVSAKAMFEKLRKMGFKTMLRVPRLCRQTAASLKSSASSVCC